MYLSQKLHTNSRFANLRAISDLFSFFLYTLYTDIMLWHEILELQIQNKELTTGNIEFQYKIK